MNRLELIKLTGYINVTLLSLIISMFVLRRINKYKKKKSDHLKKWIVITSKLHKPLAMALTLTGLTHGWIAIMAIRLHTGYILWFSIVLNLLVYAYGKAFKKPIWLKIHRAMAGLIISLLIIHLWKPYFF